MDEKYGKYIASREWALKKEAVKDRSGGICERCKANPSSSVHHLSYKNLYNEPLEDLLDVCEYCHEYLSGKSSIDPTDVIYKDAMDALRKIFMGSKASCYEDEARILLCCPVCGFEYLHFEAAEIIKGNDNGNANWPGRGDKIKILFWCENQHAFNICFGFHKGNTFFFLQKSTEEDVKKLPWNKIES
jgi:hypothetical protein